MQFSQKEVRVVFLSGSLQSLKLDLDGLRLGESVVALLGKLREGGLNLGSVESVEDASRLRLVNYYWPS